MEDRQTVAAALLALADSLGATAEELAYAVGLTPWTLNSWKVGRRTPTRQALDALRRGVAKIAEKRLLVVHRLLAETVALDDETAATFARTLAPATGELVDALADVIAVADTRAKAERDMIARAGEMGVNADAVRASLEIECGFIDQSRELTDQVQLPGLKRPPQE